jgi:osmoprotectant transport system substrate-binding protein
LGLHRVYGILFDDFQPLDAGGPKTVAALKDDEVQVGLLFSTDPSIAENGFVPLEDDKHLQNAENITPVIRSDKVDAKIRGVLDEVSARLSTQVVTQLIGRVDDGQSVPTVARQFLVANGLV